MTLPKIKLKAARVNAEMTQEDVANTLGRNKQTIVHDLIALSELYKIPIEYLEVPPRRK